MQILAHRLSWSFANGRLPKPDYMICHTCDNRRCVRPDHLFEGKSLDNVRDMIFKKRDLALGHGRSITANNSFSAKLKASDVLEIVSLHKNGEKCKELALRYSVSLTAIREVVKGVTWSSTTGITYSKNKVKLATRAAATPDKGA